MSYSLDWFLPDRVLLLTICGNAGVQTVTAAAQELLAWLDDSAGQLHAIIDTNYATCDDYHIMEALDHPATIDFFSHPNLGWTVYVGAKEGTLYRYASTIYLHVFEARLRWVTSFRGALQVLREVDADLCTLRLPFELNCG